MVFVPGKPEIIEIVELLKNNMRRGLTALYPYGFHSDTPVQDRDFLFKGGKAPNVSRREELRSLATGAAYQKYVQNNSKDAQKLEPPYRQTHRSFHLEQSLLRLMQQRLQSPLTSVGCALTHAW